MLLVLWMGPTAASGGILHVASCALHAKMKDTPNEANSVSVIQSVHCEGVGMVEEADGKKKKRKTSPTREFITAKRTSIDLESGATLFSSSWRSCPSPRNEE